MEDELGVTRLVTADVPGRGGRDALGTDGWRLEDGGDAPCGADADADADADGTADDDIVVDAKGADEDPILGISPADVTLVM